VSRCPATASGRMVRWTSKMQVPSPSIGRRVRQAFDRAGNGGVSQETGRDRGRTILQIDLYWIPVGAQKLAVWQASVQDAVTCNVSQRTWSGAGYLHKHRTCRLRDILLLRTHHNRKGNEKSAEYSMGQIGSGEAQEHQMSRIAQTVGYQSFSFILFNQHSYTTIRTP